MMILNNKGDTVMKNFKSVLKSNFLTGLALFLSVFSAVVYYAARTNWIFVDFTVGIKSFTFMLLYIIIINSVFLCLILSLKLKSHKIADKKFFNIINFISILLAIVLFIAAMIYSVSMLTEEEASQGYLLYLKDSLFKAAFFSLVPFFALFFPHLKGKRIRCVILTVVLASVSLLLISEFIPLSPYKFTSKPSVLNTGDDYSIVFSTSDFGTGYVEYEYEGKTYKIYDENGGRLNTDSKIHSVNVPYEHLENNTYKIGSVRVFEQYSYGSRTGKEIISEEYNYSFNVKDEITYLVVSDWHTRLKKAYDAISYTGNYDAIILLGDASPGVDFEQQVIDNIVEFSGELSKGTCPVLYVRGNHETRGEYAGKILEALGLNEFYYNADIGNVSFVVLDSGEDKDDSHHEYGGMTDYNNYRSDMIDWLSGVEVKNEKVIALSHSWAISDVEKELSDKGWAEINRLGTSLIISGHTHQCRMIGETEREKEIMSLYPEIKGFMDGGHKGGKYIASKMVVNEKTIVLSSYSNTGEKVFEQSLNWR